MDTAKAKASHWTADLHDDRGMVGFSAAVGIGGEVVWADAVGRANVELDVPATTETKFRIGSVSKPMTAAAAALLVEDGALDLDASVHEIIPEFPEHPDADEPVTPAMLAGHIAGVRHYRSNDEIGFRHYTSVRDGLEVFIDDPYKHPPGERFSYSSYAWNLFSAVIEEAAGEPFLDVMQQRVFDPLGLDDTTADDTRRIVANRAAFYRTRSEDDNGDDGDGRSTEASLIVRNAAFHDNSYKWAGGGFLSTASDLVRFGFAHCEPGFLQDETLEMIFTSMQTSDGEATGYGLGWRMRTDDDGRQMYYHGGTSTGGGAYLLVYPDHDVVVALLSNTRTSSGRPFGRSDARELAEIFFEHVVDADG